MDGALKLTPGRTVTFTVPGLPKAKERPRFRVVTPKKGKPFSQAYTPKVTRGFEADCAVMAKAAMRGEAPMMGPVVVIIYAFFPIPKSYTKKRQAAIRAGLEAFVKKPDEDNVGKAVKDAMNGIVYGDDCQIVRGRTDKDWTDEPRVIVRVTELVPIVEPSDTSLPMPLPEQGMEKHGVPASAVTDVKTVAEPAQVNLGGKGTQSGTSKTACGADSIQTCPHHDKPGGYWCRSCLPEKWSTPEARAKQGITLIGEDA
jgi:Holliday junction resolvase RusA-like endonuclease